MNEKQYPNEEPPVFDKEYCDKANIRSDWFKFDKTLCNLLLGLVDEGENEKGEWIIVDEQFLAYTVYAIISYQLYGDIPPALRKRIYSKAMKLSKQAFEHAVAEIEESRCRLAENRWNGRKGGLSRGRNY